MSQFVKVKSINVYNWSERLSILALFCGVVSLGLSVDVYVKNKKEFENETDTFKLISILFKSFDSILVLTVICLVLWNRKGF
jgi:hypothetical protein